MAVVEVGVRFQNWQAVPLWIVDAGIWISRLFPSFCVNYGIQKLHRVGSFAQLCQEIREKNPNFLRLKCRFDTRPTQLFYGCCTEMCGNDCYELMDPLRLDADGVAYELFFLVVDAALALLLLAFIESNAIREITRRFKKRVQRKIVEIGNENQELVAEFPSIFKKAASSFEKRDQNKIPQLDPDVIQEQKRVIKLYMDKKLEDKEMLGVANLTKVFNRIPVVDHLTFGVHSHECFGLLGINGAGKSTTFRMLTGDLPMTAGEAVLGGIWQGEELYKYQMMIGYCPQFEGLLDLLTGREMLYLFGRLKGIQNDDLKSVVDALILMVDLHKHADKCTYTYSGGNKRKLSLAIAIMGSPAIVFLDEPTSGVDPAARRRIWSTLGYVQRNFKCAIILTSHSMDECEALCDRIVIMVNGQFKCLGSVQHLRNKFGQGFTAMIKMKRHLDKKPDYRPKVEQYIKKNLPSAVLKDYHQGYLHYHITDKSVGWSQLFRVMNKAKQQLQLKDYLVGGTTLEQIFLTFARRQRQAVQHKVVK